MSTVAKRITREINYIDTLLHDLNIYIQGGNYKAAKNSIEGVKKDIISSLTSIEHLIEREAIKETNHE